MSLDRDVLATQQVADLLGVSAARVRQLVEEGKLPPPTQLGPRAHVWRRADVEVLLPGRPGEEVTRLSTLLTSAAAPLIRRHDLVLDFPAASSVERAHVRVFEGDAEEGRRTVVVLGGLVDTGGLANHVERIAEIVDARLLSGRGPSATWFTYTPGSAFIGWHEITNVVFRSRLGPTSRPVQRVLVGLRRRPQRPDACEESFVFEHPSWHAENVAEVERVIGQPLECFPPSAYTEGVIGRWQRAGRVVEVDTDPECIGTLLSALARLEHVPADDPYRGAAHQACETLAHEVCLRLEYRETSHWDDGTEPPYGRTPDRYWPGTFAARLVPLTMSALDQERVNRYHRDTDWPWSADELGRHKDLLGQVRSWQVDVGPYGDPGHQDVGLHTALSETSSLLAHWIGVADPASVEDDYPDKRPRGPFDVVGPHDKRYLETVHWTPQFAELPVHRMLREKFWPERRPHVRFGVDPWERVVAYDGGDAPAVFAVDWPLRPHDRPDPIPDEAFIVGDGEGGSRPVYIELPDGQLDPLPRQPSLVANDWNFGYGGGGPGALVFAILRTFESVDGVDFEQLPERWVDDQVCYSSKDELRISVRDLRRRIQRRDGS